VEANVVVPGDEAARITAVSEDVGFVVVAGDADVVGPCDFPSSECLNVQVERWMNGGAMCSLTQQNLGFSVSGKVGGDGVFD
jgi:hypothetical protein